MSRTGGDTIRVLHVDDESEFLDLAATLLEREHESLEVVTETDARAALDRLEGTTVDCIVSDYDMPRMDGLAFLEAVRAECPDLPFVLFTGKGSEEIASEAISAGVTEYLQKESGTDQFAVLANRIERAVGEARARDALEESERMLSTLISNIPGMVYRCRNEPDWPMEFVSQGCTSLTGYDPEALENDEVRWGPDVLHPEDEGTMWETVQAALEAREPFEVTYRIVTKDGETRWAWEQGRGVYEGDELVAIEGFITDITDRRETDQRLQTYEAIVESMDDGAYVLDEDDRFEFVNRTVADAFGRDPDDLVGERSFVTSEAVEEAARERYERAVERVRSGEDDQARLELDMHLPDRGETTLNFRFTPLDSGDESDRVVVIARDVTERKQRQRELERYELLVESVGDAMYTLDEDGVITMANEAMAEHLNCTRAELVGSPVSEWIPDEDVETGTELIATLLADDRQWGTFEMETVAKDGERRTNEDKVGVLRDDDGDFAGSVGVIRDISDRKERERELERYETIIQAVGDPVYALDADGRYTFVNDAVEAVTGYTPDDILGEHVSTIMTEEDIELSREKIRELLRSDDRTNDTFEMVLVSKDGDHIPHENHVALLPFGDDGEFRGTAGIVRDITERKQRERRLEEFAGIVSHDLQNPLNVIEGRIELARESGDLSHLDAAEASLERMEALIDDLLSLARQGQTVGEAEPVALGDLVRHAWRHVETGAATLDVGDLGTVTADGDRLHELFENLFRNAVEHGDPDVTVRVGRLDPGRMSSSSRNGEGSPAGFFVEDDGPGIPPDRREDVFEHGFSTRREGTGYGLSIVENVVEAHDWEITVTESDDGGARFEIVDR